MAAKLNVKVFTKAYKEFVDMLRALEQFSEADESFDGGEFSGSSKAAQRNFKLAELLRKGAMQSQVCINLAQQFNKKNAMRLRNPKRRRR